MAIFHSYVTNYQRVTLPIIILYRVHAICPAGAASSSATRRFLPDFVPGCWSTPRPSQEKCRAFEVLHGKKHLMFVMFMMSMVIYVYSCGLVRNYYIDSKGYVYVAFTMRVYDVTCLDKLFYEYVQVKERRETKACIYGVSTDVISKQWWNISRYSNFISITISTNINIDSK